MQKILMATALVAVILAGPARADTVFTFFTGNDLYQQCSGSHVSHIAGSKGEVLCHVRLTAPACANDDNPAGDVRP